MKKGFILIVLLAVVCAGALFYSTTVYNSKIREAASVKSAKQPPSESSTPLTKNEASTESEKVLAAPKGDLLAENLFPNVKSLMQKRFADGENVQMLIIGSGAIQPVAERFATALTEKFGESVTVDAVTADMTSPQFIEQGLPEIDWSTGYDIVIYEPFTLKNNGEVVIEREQQDLMKVKNTALESVKDAVFIVTPPQPIFQANYYDRQVSALKNFTAANNIPFVDHWTSWPATNSKDLLEFVGKDQSLTNRGVQTWSNALIQTFLK
ncbi:hypothetical protein [Sporosarcina sp. A2]|uniref:hypothetical protein n=1 Tax=Sporosarcina sp. A2 TaxID=3393449 RepID=UPI003D7B4AA1